MKVFARQIALLLTLLFIVFSACQIIDPEGDDNGNQSGGKKPAGAVSGLFTVNKQGKKVYFSQGNLQYDMSKKTWRFAPNQYDVIGAANAKNITSGSGYIDLFGWGTSGYDSGNKYFMPYEIVNGDDWEYGYGTGAHYGPKGSYNLTGTFANCDWGVYNAISNGGNKAGLWRTLLIEEWRYIFFDRKTESGMLFAKAQVNNVNGVIVLPDDWSADIPLVKTDTRSADYSVNELSSSEWKALEAKGCVFLPAAGYRYVEVVSSVNTEGDYWSANYGNDADACFIWFDKEKVQMDYSWPRWQGRSVRLVQDAG